MTAGTETQDTYYFNVISDDEGLEEPDFLPLSWQDLKYDDI